MVSPDDNPRSNVAFGIGLLEIVLHPVVLGLPCALVIKVKVRFRVEKNVMGCAQVEGVESIVMLIYIIFRHVESVLVYCLVHEGLSSMLYVDGWDGYHRSQLF